jgi:hypothetical protein
VRTASSKDASLSAANSFIESLAEFSLRTKPCKTLLFEGVVFNTKVKRSPSSLKAKN